MLAQIAVVLLALTALASARPRLTTMPYSSCGDAVGCFGLSPATSSLQAEKGVGCYGCNDPTDPPRPKTCIQNQDCAALVTYSMSSLSMIKVNLYSNVAADTSDGVDKYVSVGFNNIGAMNKSVILNCINKANEAGVVTTYTFANEHAPPAGVKLPGVVKSESEVSDFIVKCSFDVQTALVSGGQTFDLSEPIHMILAVGDAEKNKVKYHDSNRVITEEKVSITEFPNN